MQSLLYHTISLQLKKSLVIAISSAKMALSSQPSSHRVQSSPLNYGPLRCIKTKLWWLESTRRSAASGVLSEALTPRIGGIRRSSASRSCLPMLGASLKAWLVTPLFYDPSLLLILPSNIIRYFRLTACPMWR